MSTVWNLLQFHNARGHGTIRRNDEVLYLFTAKMLIKGVKKISCMTTTTTNKYKYLIKLSENKL